jgi:hypothetical protein
MIRVPSIVRQIRSVDLDEGHLMHFQGVSQYGSGALRSGYGSLESVEALLPSDAR